MSAALVRETLARVDAPFAIDPTVEFRTPNRIEMRAGCKIKKGTIVDGRTRLGECGVLLGPDTYIKEYCYIDAYGGRIETAGCCAIGQFTMLAGQGGLAIGKYVMLGGHCYVLTSNHVTESLEVPYILQGDRLASVTIEDNVWIGGGSIVLPGVRIGNNSVIGAGSIVARDVPPDSIYVDRNPKLLDGVLQRLRRRAVLG